MASVRPNPARPERPFGRHPALVTADRMLDAAAAWGDRLTDRELRALSTAQEALRRVGEIERDRPRLTLAELGAQARARRHAAAAERDVERAMRALAVLGSAVSPGCRRVAEARIAYPDATWAEIGDVVGARENAAWMSFRRLCAMAARQTASKGGQ